MALFKTSSSLATTSTSPVARLGLMVFFAAQAYNAVHFNNVFAADSFCLGKIFTGVVGVNHYLHNAAAVAQVNKNQSAVVASFGNPAAKHNFFFVVGFGQACRNNDCVSNYSYFCTSVCKIVTISSTGISVCVLFVISFKVTAPRSSSPSPKITANLAFRAPGLLHLRFHTARHKVKLGFKPRLP